jgi:hypothetical protein
MTFRKELESLLNKYSQENGSNTPDYILADFLCNCLCAFDTAVNFRATWHSEQKSRGWRSNVQPQEMEWPSPPKRTGDTKGIIP